MTDKVCRWWTLGTGKASTQLRCLPGSRQASPGRSLWTLQPCLKQAEQLGKALQEPEHLF